MFFIDEIESHYVLCLFFGQKYYNKYMVKVENEIYKTGFTRVVEHMLDIQTKNTLHSTDYIIFFLLFFLWFDINSLLLH